MNKIRAYYKISDYLATSGQPDAEQFETIADAGFSTIINLAMPTSDFAIANEDEIVKSLGMSYMHIPVSWENPQLSDVQRFFSIMQDLEGRKVWVHCALNMRASCFVYLYRKCVLHLAEPLASFPMSEIWQPTGAWLRLVDAVKAIESS